MSIAFKVYQATVFSETVWGNQKERWDLKRKGKDPLVANQSINVPIAKRKGIREKTTWNSKRKIKRIETLAEKC